MADYPELAPTLSALGGVVDTPGDSEDRSKLPSVDRQTRKWVYDFLGTLIDEATGKIKSDAFNSDSIPAGSVRGSDANDGNQREILQGSVGTVDLRDQAVDATKLADAAVTTAKILDAAVTEAKLADGAVTSDKIAASAVGTTQIAANAVGSAQLANNAVGTAQLANGAVTATQLAAGSTGGDKLGSGTAGQVQLHNGTTWVATTLSGAASVSATGVVTLSLTSSSFGWIRVSERVASGTNAGASSAASWTQKRGNLTAWVIDEQTGGTAVALAGTKLNLQINGVYLVTATIPGYSVGLHKAKMTLTPVSGPAVDYVGTSECAAAGVTTSSKIHALVTVTGASAGTPATLEFSHWTELAKGTNGLGIPVGSGEVERYAAVELLRIATA